MRFTIRSSTSPGATIDRIILRTLGLPNGGVIAVGATHVLVRPGETAESTALELDEITMANAGVAPGSSVDVRRAVLPTAEAVQFADDAVDHRTLVHALQGRPVTTGDRLVVEGAYLDGAEASNLEVVRVEPDGAGMIGAATRFGDLAVVEAATRAGTPHAVDAAAPMAPPEEGPTTAAALLAGLDNQLDVLTGWFSLLATSEALAAAWGLPEVAGVLIEGPNGCGKSQLIAAAADRSGTPVAEVDTSSVFKPERLLDKLSAALDAATGPRVIFVDRLETLTGSDAMATFRTQFIAVLRWFLDEVATRQDVACVLGVARVADLDEAIAMSPLLPRQISIPPPDLERRRLLFEAAFRRVPTSADLDHDRLAALSSGFSGADVVAAVVQASAEVARTGGEVTTDIAVAAVEAITPSLGSVPMGQMVGFGFEKVANLDEVKQRLTEAVIWPMEEPARFERLGIDPPRGILLYGPPGTGKTFVIRALAHEAGAAFFAVKGAELLDKYVGESERGVRDVFARARAAEPSIIFFDELDALAPVRGRSTSTVSDSVVAAMLTEIDGVVDLGRVAVIGATNRRDLIDPALLRGGRFETHIHLGLPEQSARRALLEISDVPLAAEVDRDELAARTEGLSFADLSSLLREAALTALRDDEEAIEVGWAELDTALERFRTTRQDG